MITRYPGRLIRVLLVLLGAAALASCEQPRVYGSVGFSSFSGGGFHGGGSFGTSVTVGGRIL